MLQVHTLEIRLTLKAPEPSVLLWGQLVALRIFVVGFQNYLSYSGLSGADHEAIPRGFDNSSRDDSKVIHAENSLDLSEKSSQEPKVSSGHLRY
jgi:hypothetical protein